MRLVIQPDSEKASLWIAEYIAEKISAACKAGKPFVLGLPTGSSPLLIYREFIKMNKEGKLSFKNVITFNMDEYLGLPATHTQSYRYFMLENLFNHIDIDLDNTHYLNGMTDDWEKECARYEEAINNAGLKGFVKNGDATDCHAGGIDLFLGGMGGNGHIAFNEPGSSFASRTRLVTLDKETREANSRFFENDPEKVPAAALSVGIATIMDAREVVIIVTGKTKARALKAVTEGEATEQVPLSCLKNHNNAIIVCDEEAAEQVIGSKQQVTVSSEK